MEPTMIETAVSDPTVIENDTIGRIVTVNRLKHYAFLKRKDNEQKQNIFAREASIINQTEKPKFYISNICKFDQKKTPRGFEAINIKIEKRNIDSITKLPKIPQIRINHQRQMQIPCEFFQSAIPQLFGEALKKTNNK